MEQLFADYLEDKLTVKQRKELETLLASDETLRNEFEELKAFYADMHKPTELEPSANLDLGFYIMLEKAKGVEQKNKEKLQSSLKISWLNSPVIKIAAGIILLLGIFWIGRRTADKDLNIGELATLKEDVKETRRMLAMLQNESASERIQAVNYSYDLSKPDSRVLEALIKTLNTDTNINVRIAAAEALSHFGTEKIARDALIQTLLTQKEPTLQITVIDILASLGDKRAVKPIQKLLQSTDTEDFVKRKAIESVKVLSL